MATTGNYINANQRSQDPQTGNMFSVLTDHLAKRAEEQHQIKLQAQQQAEQLKQAQRILALMNASKNTQANSNQDNSDIGRANRNIENPTYADTKVIKAPKNAMMSLANGAFGTLGEQLIQEMPMMSLPNGEQGDIYGQPIQPMESLVSTAMQAAPPQVDDSMIQQASPVVQQEQPRYALDIKFDSNGRVIPSIKDTGDELQKIQEKAAEYGIDGTNMSRSQIISAIAQKRADMNNVPEGYDIIGFDQKGIPMRRRKIETVADKKFALDLQDRERINTAHKEMVNQSAQDTLSTIKEVKEGISNFGFFGNIPSIPGTDRAEWESNVNKLLATKITDLMRTMKEASKTGATGFGALSAPELKVLQDGSTALKRGLKQEDALKYLNQMEQLAQKVLNGQSSQGLDEEKVSSGDPEYDRYLQLIGQ